MATAWLILELDKILKDNQPITDEIVKRAYFLKVKQFPPDHYPEKFRKIREAYELLEDERSRVAYHLFNEEEASDNAILTALFSQNKRLTPSKKHFLQALKNTL